MNNKQKVWIKELETTTKQQGGFVLKENKRGVDFYCCLGIARELYGTRKEKQNINATCLSDRLTKELELRSPLGELKTPFELNGIKFSSLAMMNDKNFNFREIAAIIKRDPKNVFTEDQFLYSSYPVPIFFGFGGEILGKIRGGKMTDKIERAREALEQIYRGQPKDMFYDRIRAALDEAEALRKAGEWRK